MATVKPKAGMTYDFDVSDIIQLPIGGITSFAGQPSVAYDRLIPADATLVADGLPVGQIRLNLQPTVGINSTDLAVGTQDALDRDLFIGKKLILRCTFVA